MWPSSWRSLGKVAHRQLKRVYPARRHDDYFEDDDLPLGEVNQPLLPTTPYLLPALPIHKRSFWRSRLSQLFLILCGVVFLVGTPRFVAFLHLYTDPGYADTFNPSYRPNAQDIEHLVPAMDISERAPTMAMLQNDLAARLDSLGMPAYENTITCPSLDSTASISRYGHLASPLRGRVLLALNLYNNGAVLPSVGRSLLKLAAFLGPQNVLVSIFENGSSDNTMLGLAHLAAILTAADVPHTIRSDTHRTVWKDVDRIEQLALYRNTVMEPLYATANLTRRQMSGEVLSGNERPFESVVFINDVYFCPTDALELLHVRATQEAHATCGLDYRWRHNALKGLFGSGPKFYDNWVARTLNGNTFRSRLDVFSEMRNGFAELFTDPTDAAVHARWASARPFPVYSCWNGMIALDARPFLGVKLNAQTEEDAMRLDRAPVRFRGARRDKLECAASECKLIARDFWKRGFDRWVLVPYVHTTYVQDLYNNEILEDLQARARGRWRSPSPSLVTLPEAPRMVAPGEELDIIDIDTRNTSSSPSSVKTGEGRRTWTYPSSPHPSVEDTPFEYDIFSLPRSTLPSSSPADSTLPPSSSSPPSSRSPEIDPSADINTPPIDSSSDAPIPSSEDDETPAPSSSIDLYEPQGEELDLIAWERTGGPQTVVCWPYHRVGNVDWWWTKVIEKVKKPLRHLRR